VALVWRRDRKLSPRARACIEFVREEAVSGDPLEGLPAR
jgi:DNA-binding transcriptional LysR family regulator